MGMGMMQAMNAHGMAGNMAGGMGSGMQAGGIGAAPFSPSAAMVAGGGHLGGADAMAAIAMPQSNQPLAAEKKEDPTLVYDYVEKDTGLAEELSQFVENLIDEGKDKSWEQLLELHSSLYAVIARHEHQKDRFCALADLRDSLDQWRRRCSADAA